MAGFHRNSNIVVFNLMQDLGMDLDDNLVVKNVQLEGQAHKLSVEIGWRLKRLGTREVKNMRAVDMHQKSCRKASKSIGSIVSKCEAQFEIPKKKIFNSSCYSSIKNAPLNKARRDHNEFLRKTNRREPEERSLKSTNEHFMDRYETKKQENTSNHSSHTSSLQQSWSPASLFSTIPDSVKDTTRIEKKGITLCDEVQAHEIAKINKISNKSKQCVLQSQSISMQPELTSLGHTANKVYGSSKWQRSRAKIRRPTSCKPCILLEVFIRNGIHNEENHHEDGEWVPACLEKELESSRIYTLLKENKSTIESIEIRFDETHSRVRKFGTQPKYSRVFCFLCGKEVGLSSLSFHFQKCLLKWDRRISLPFSKESMELFDPRSLPCDTSDEEDLKLYNEKALFVFKEYIKPKCPGCARNFMLDSLIGHVKECCKSQPRKVASVIAKYGNEGYVPLAGEVYASREKASTFINKQENMDLLQRIQHKHKN